MNWNRRLSGSLGAIYVMGAFVEGGAKAGFMAALVVSLPLACIWFGEAMGGYIGPSKGGYISQATPGLFVCIAGWLLLLLPIVIGVVYAFTGSKT
ncbi:MAG: hypothetical protein JWR69_1362 [Pedosphaera sp.]|nr:hypothetical protein [Pedosphaera sp.]